MTEGRATSEQLAHAVRMLKIKLGEFPQEAQDDIQTFMRTFRNMLAAGPPAEIALMLVAAELSLEQSRKREAPRGSV